MNEKLTLQDLVDLLAKNAGLTKKEADAFLREFLSVVTDSIFSGEQVKIKDFGTFKLTDVKSRESVNVNTGEKIEIPAHHKLSFIPDKALKMLLNKPFEQFETTLLEDSVSFDSIEESDEPVESPEDEDTGVDELDITGTTIDTEPEQPVESKKNDEDILKEKKKSEDISVESEENISSAELKSRSSSDDRPVYVYTYTNEPEKSETDSSITIVVPTEQILVEESKTLLGESSEKEVISSVSFVMDDEDEENGEEIPLNINKVQEKIDQLKEAIDALARVNTQGEDLEEEPHTGIDTQNYIEKQSDYPISEELVINDADETVDAGLNDGSSVSEDSALLVEHQDISDEIARDSLDEDLLKTLLEDTNQSKPKLAPVENSSDEKQEKDDDDDDFDYYSYRRDTVWTKFRRRIPIIIFLLVVIVFGGYHFFKLFEQKHDYKNTNTYRSFSDVDTLPNIKATTEDRVPLLDDEAEIVIPEGIDLPALDQKTDSLSGNNAAIIHDESVNDSTSQKTLGETISPNLHIEVLRKAAYFRNGLFSFSPEKEDGQAATSDPDFKFPLTEEVKSGASLKLIAKKYYGNANLWVYIYEENKKGMKSIDALSVGQKLVVPDLKKYNTSIGDPEANQKAKVIEGKIYSTIERP